MRWLKRLTNRGLLKRDIRFLFQRLIRGWDDSETWSMDQSLSKVILPRLEKFQELRGGCPANLTDEEWDDKLQEMIWGFNWFASGRQYDLGPDHDINSTRAHAALALFAEYYGHLWW